MDVTKESWLAKNITKIAEKSEETKIEGNAQLCERVSSRLHALLEILREKDAAQRARVAATFETAVAEFLYALRLQNHYNFVLYWVATSQRLVAQVCQAHKRADEIYKELLVKEEDAELAEWQSRLAGDRTEQERWLESKLENMSTSEIINQVPSPAKLKEMLEMLTNQLQVWPTDSPNNDKVSFSDELKLSEKQAQLMQTTLDNVTEYTRIHGDGGKWYVPQEDVKRGEKPFKEGTFGTLYEGTRINVKTGERRKVAIKNLDSKMSALDDNRKFSRELTSWSRLKHEHILEMLGANHVSRPKFFISEFASDGNFVDFFGQKQNRKLLWRLFVQAAEGLKFLHEKKVEHGGLKCTNILLTKPEGGDVSQLIVKLSDFGMSIVRTESVSVSINAKSQMVRYKAPERLMQSSEPVDFCRSDIYSLGLCIFDAATGEPPFSTMGDEEIIASKLNFEPIEQPEEGFTEREWALVAKMCDNNPRNRPDLAYIIEEMKQLDRMRNPDEAEEAGTVKTDDAEAAVTVCPACHIQVSPDYHYCGKCGASITP